MNQNPENNPASDTGSLTKKVVELIALSVDKASHKISLDEPLFSSQGRFDSFALMELVLHLEETFNLKIPDQDLDPDIFYSARTIIAYLTVRLN